LSTLTKILIVLLTVSAIFLCGIVVTYVANADNYKEKYDSQGKQLTKANAKVKKLTKELKEKIDSAERQKKDLNKEISALKSDLKNMKGQTKDLESEKAALMQKVNSWASITKDFYETTDKQGQLLKNTLEELNDIQEKQVKQQKELKETTTYLREKLAIIDTLESEKARLVEEKVELQSRLSKPLMPLGQQPAATTPVTRIRPEGVQAVKRRETTNIALNGLVTAVDMRNDMASISIGSADGVKNGMKFHVTRGDEFICDILIIEVDTDEAVGVLELVQKQPNVGDTISTNLL